MRTPVALTLLKKPILEPDYARLVIRSFVPLEERILSVLARVASLSGDEIQKELEELKNEFSADHGDLLSRFEEHYAQAELLLGLGNEPSPANPAPSKKLLTESRLLAGAYFTSEYAFEATALFNPSIVPDPEQGECPAGTIRFIMSTRSVGEGHISSLSFRTGTINKNGNIHIDPVGRAAVQGRQPARHGTPEKHDDALLPANVACEIEFDEETKLSERLLFPITQEERNGIEDARFVRFTDDDGTIRHYATYTAYDGKNIAPKLIATDDFRTFKLLPLGGAMARNKGMALFPRKIDGRYVMLSRVDGESLYLMFSADLLVWNEGIKIVSPRFPWEFMQIGNCGSPIELPEGWLVLTHGVGSFRRYSIGAILLDKNDPAKVIGRLSDPLISPGEQERTGYVPNVVYTCGCIVNEGLLIIPYGSADRSIAFITLSLKELVEKLLRD
jgi:predicted GH43/DUF377 family glycosyl hydrolase